METLEQKRDLAACKYCKVEYEGLNNAGEKRYSADNITTLELRAYRMPAFHAGWDAACVELSYVEENNDKLRADNYELLDVLQIIANGDTPACHIARHGILRVMGKE